ncbi:hypothetical protein A2U01_0105098, partial [Trifolium medium]|nr:hypothetical protein [Trifolium medium]
MVVVRGWVPQRLILKPPAVGGFLTNWLECSCEGGYVLECPFINGMHECK